MPAFDLQCHSTCSDGAFGPARVMELAHAQGIELIALTDHDTVDGVAEAMAAAHALGMRFSAAAELSSVDGPHTDLHILGYELDPADPALRATLEDFRADRLRRIEAIADRLADLGFAVDRTVMDERRAAGLPIGRPHVADAVLHHPDNPAIDRDAFFAEYIVPGAKAFVARERPTVGDAIGVIHTAGGVAVWAHPFWDIDDPAEVLARIDASPGLDGVEVFYASHTEEQTRFLHRACSERGLLMTGSTDFHSPTHEHFSGFGRFETYGLEPALGPIGTRSARV